MDYVCDEEIIGGLLKRNLMTQERFCEARS